MYEGPFDRDQEWQEASRQAGINREGRIRQMKFEAAMKGVYPWVNLLTSVVCILAAALLYWGVNKALTQYIEDAKKLPPRTVEVEKIVEVEKACPECKGAPEGVLFQLVKKGDKIGCVLFADGSEADIPTSACPALVQGLLGGGEIP